MKNCFEKLKDYTAEMKETVQAKADESWMKLDMRHI